MGARMQQRTSDSRRTDDSFEEVSLIGVCDWPGQSLNLMSGLAAEGRA